MDMDVDVNVDACAVQHVCGVRACWVHVGGARNVVGPEHIHWGHSKHARGIVVQMCWGG